MEIIDKSFTSSWKRTWFSVDQFPEKFKKLRYSLLFLKLGGYKQR